MPSTKEYTFAELVEGREDEFPTLAAAVQCVVPATDIRIEWVCEERINNRILKWRETNYTQIFRYPYSGPVEEGSYGEGGFASLEEAHGAGKTKFLEAVELTLVTGFPSHERWGGPSGHPLYTCGGTRYYLGRDLVIGDHIRLRPLREPFLRTYDTMWVSRETGKQIPCDSDEPGEWVPDPDPTYEWICETSLQVYPQGVTLAV